MHLNISIKTEIQLGVHPLLDKCVVIIDELIELRKAKGLTQRELAKAANLAQPAIARLESKAATPQLDTLIKIASALDYELALVPVSK